MNHKSVFVSKSAKPELLAPRYYAKDKTKTKAKGNVIKADLVKFKKATVFWMGKPLPKSLLGFGEHLGLDILKLDGDITLLINAQALVIHEVDTYRFNGVIAAINLAVNYDVPVFWIDKNVAPRQWMFSFKKVFVGDLYAGFFWKEVMQWIV